MPDLPQHLARVPVGRERLSREKLSSYQRERILLAATGVFAKRGYQETTIDNIVAAAKSSVGSFYSLFDGKEECFLAVFDRIVERSGAQISDALQPASDWTEEGFLGLREALSIFIAEPQAARIVLVEAQTAGEAATARYEGLLDAVSEWLRAGRNRESQAAGLPPSFERAAVAGLAFYLQQRLLGSEHNELRPLLAETAPVLLGPIVGEAELRGHLAAVR